MFDPDRVAYFEAAGWRAYYDRRWAALLWLTAQLCREEFNMSRPASLLAAYYVARASKAWAPLDHDVAKVQRYLYRFYRLAGRYTDLRFDSQQVARLELEYFDVHRRLAGVPDKSEFVDTLTRLHAALFGMTPAQARPSAERRVAAAETVDLITSHRSKDVERDWALLEQQLRECYRLVRGAVEERRGTGR